MFVISGPILKASGGLIPHSMPLCVDNDLHLIVLRFGSTDDNAISFSVHCDSCAAMNMVNEQLHMWIMKNHPDCSSK